jgi:hypothetical protein
MSKSTDAELGTLASVKRKGVISSIHWEGLFFLAIALLLGFQERFLANDASAVPGRASGLVAGAPHAAVSATSITKKSSSFPLSVLPSAHVRPIV